MLFPLFLLAFLFLPFLALPAAARSSSDETPAARIVVNGLASLPERDFLDLLNLKKGSPIDRAAVGAGIRRAFLTGIFDDIVVERSDADPSVVKISVREKRTIASLRIRGAHHFSKRFIRKYLDIRAGERVSTLRLRTAVRNLKSEMEKRGFPRAQADYLLLPEKGNRVKVVVDIREGEPDIVRKIQVAGPVDAVHSFLRLSEGEVFDRTKMESLRARVTQFFKKQGYIEASLSYSFQEGLLSITVLQGRKLSVSFVGNTALSMKELMKEVPFFELNELNEDLIEETKERIITLYHKYGYPSVQAAPVQTVAASGTHIDFFLFEGERYRIGSLVFEGAALSREKLRDILPLRAGEFYNPDLLESCTDTLLELYHALGYINAEIKEPEVRLFENKADILFRIQEGAQALVQTITITGNKALSDDVLSKAVTVKEGQPYNEVDIADTRRRILELYNRQGYLDARVSVEREISEGHAQVSILLEEGEISRFGKSVIIGNEHTKTQIISREFLHSEGTPFDYGLLLKERQELYRLGLFSDVEIVPAEKTDGLRDIIYRVREANAGAVEVGFGYGEYERYRGFLDISYRNLWGMNRQASFRTELSSLEQRYILSYNEPWFLVRDFTLKAALLYENRRERNIDTNETRYHLVRKTATAGVEKKTSDQVKAELYYDFSVVNTTDVQPDVVLSREDVGTLIISGIRPGLIYDSRDNPFEPRKGVLAGLSFKVASSLLFSETDFLKLTLYGNKYQGLGKRFVLALSAKGGAAMGFGATRELPIVERFFLGGRTTVRGYEQDTLGPKGADGTPTGGNAFLMGSAELRSDVGKGFGIVTFLDAGNVWRKIEDFDLSGMRYTTGIGIRYTTPVGPFRIDYGYKLNREQGESKGEIHFSLGHAF
ncbi:MAG: outer membrane protein assembly factor BamA [Thermodesulfovibrionales bacterium]